MILKSGLYKELVNDVKRDGRQIIIYGAGMIGQIVIPYIIQKYFLHEYVDCFVDADERKWGQNITIGTHEYEIRSPRVLEQATHNTVILLTNSKFFPIIECLDKIEALNEVNCYIVPLMQKMEQEEAIPRIIHYCWFGQKEMPDILKTCIESWHKVCPDYEIKKWDEKNYDVSKHVYTKQAAEYKKYGFVSDVARLDILYENGGIYLDTDVTLLKPLDGLLHSKGFVGVEQWGNINSGGGIGAVAHHPMIREMLEYRLKFPFIYDDGTLNIETNGFYETPPFIKHGMRINNTLQIVNDMIVLPSSVFHPYDYISCERNININTISIHHFYGGWMGDEDQKIRTYTQENYREIIKRIEKQNDVKKS